MITIKLLATFLATATISFVLFFALLKQPNGAALASQKKQSKAEKQALKAELKEEQWSWHNMIMSKWMAFGGGFYGVIAVLTYVVVEFWELVDFFTSESTLWSTLTNIGVGDVVNLFVNSLMNFITAIAWPAYWLKKIDPYPVWVWFLVAYAGYTAGQFLAKSMNNPHHAGS